MGTEILNSFSHLQCELEEAKNSLKGVDENIKRLIGRDPSDLTTRPGQKRPLDDRNSKQPFQKFNRVSEAENISISKRRNPNTVSVFSRLSDKVPDEPVRIPSRGLISKVIAAPKQIPSRQAVLDKQNKDEKFKARNRRMFGALLGTLQRFQQDECKLKKREEKRNQIEKKIEEHEQQEKEEIKREKQELFLNRKKKQQEIKMIELKMLRMKEYAAWEQSQKPRSNFILTKAKPHIHYLPRKMDDKSKEHLERSKKDIEEHIEKRRQAVFEELNHIEERMKRSFESKNNIEVKGQIKETGSNKRHDRRSRSESDLDEDGDCKMKSLSPEPQEKKKESAEKDKEITPLKHEESTKESSPCEKEIQNSELQTEKNEEVQESESQVVALVQNNVEHNKESEQSNNRDIYSNNKSNGEMDYSDVGQEQFNNCNEGHAVSSVNVVLADNQNESQDSNEHM